MKKSAFLFSLVLALVLSLPALAVEAGRQAQYEPSASVEQWELDAPAQSSPSPDAPDEGPSGVRAGTNGAARYASAYDLFQTWAGGAYPSYVCGVWSTDGSVDNLTIAVTKDEAGEAGKQEIMDQVADHSTLTFTYQSYSYAQLRAVQLALEKRFGDGVGLQSVATHEMENCIVVGIDTAAEGSAAFMEECWEQYGDMVRFEGGDGYRIITTAEQADNTRDGFVLPGQGASSPTWLWLACAAALVMCAGLFLRGARPVRTMQTEQGGTVSAQPLTRRQVVQAVRSSAAAPDEGLLQSVLDQLGDS